MNEDGEAYYLVEVGDEIAYGAVSCAGFWLIGPVGLLCPFLLFRAPYRYDEEGRVPFISDDRREDTVGSSNGDRRVFVRRSVVRAYRVEDS